MDLYKLHSKPEQLLYHKELSNLPDSVWDTIKYINDEGREFGYDEIEGYIQAGLESRRYTDKEKLLYKEFISKYALNSKDAVLIKAVWEDVYDSDFDAWPEAMPYIQNTDDELLADGRFDELINYAIKVKKERWPEAEHEMAKKWQYKKAFGFNKPERRPMYDVWFKEYTDAFGVTKDDLKRFDDVNYDGWGN